MSEKFIDVYAFDFEQGDAGAYESYQKLLEPLFSLEAELKQDFESSTRTYMFKDLIFSSSIANTFRATLTHDANNTNLTTDDYIVVLFYRNTKIKIEFERYSVEVEPEELVFIDLFKPFKIHTRGINVLSLNFSRNLLKAIMPITNDFHGKVLQDGPHKELLVSYMKSMELVASDLLAKDLTHMTDTLVRMVANCLTRPALNKKLHSTKNTKLSLLQVKQTIDFQIEDPNLSVDTLTQQFHVSRATIYRMFDNLGGVATYIQNRKLDYAYQELSKTGDKKHNISMLAYRLGFSHPSSFTRAFHAKFNVSPSFVVKQSKKEKQELPWYVDLDLAPFKK